MAKASHSTAHEEVAASMQNATENILAQKVQQSFWTTAEEKHRRHFSLLKRGNMVATTYGGRLFFGIAFTAIAFALRFPLFWVLANLNPGITYFAAAVLAAYAGGWQSGAVSLVLGGFASQFFRFGPFSVSINPSPDPAAIIAFLLLTSGTTLVIEFMHRQRANAERLARSLAETEQKLRALNTDLEQRVRMRTQELEATRRDDLANLQRVKSIISHMQLAAVMIDSNHTILEMNQLFCDMFRLFREPVSMIGHRAEEFSPEFLSQLVHPEQEAQHTLEVLKACQPEVDYEFSFVDGRVALRNYIPIRAGEALVGHLFLYRDVTQERRVDAAKSEFMSLASHQLRTPLSSVRWIVGRLQKKIGEGASPENVRLLADTMSAANRMGESINTMMEIARIESGITKPKNESVVIGEFLEQAMHELQPDIQRKRLIVHVDIPRTIVLHTDPSFLKEVFANLLSNAVKYTPDDGVIVVRVDETEADVRIVMQDTGYGIPESEQEKVFRKFFRGENVMKLETSGSGLGLYLVYLLVQLLHGDISFLSQEDKGTTFTVLLPRS